MKQKTTNTSPITKEELAEVLKDYPTKKDIKDALSNYATKDELSERLNSSFEAFRQENNHQFSLMRKELRTEMSKFTNLILTAIDPLLREIETRHEDREIGTAQIKRIEDDVENLKLRVSKLEHS